MKAQLIMIQMKWVKMKDKISTIRRIINKDMLSKNWIEIILKDKAILLLDQITQGLLRLNYIEQKKTTFFYLSDTKRRKRKLPSHMIK